MGAVLVKDEIYDTFMSGPEHMPELFHGYTYSGHPVAAAAGIAALEVYEEEGSFQQSRELEEMFADEAHQFDDHPRVIDVRNFGLMAAIELEPRESAPGTRGLEVHKRLFWDEDLVIRNTMDILQFCPFLNANPQDIRSMFGAVKRVLDALE